MSERRDGDRIIVTGYSAGSHFPRTEEMLPYAWEANGCTPEGPFCIPGSVYGRQLRFVGPGSVAGSVLSRGDVSLQPAATGMQRFLGGLNASGNIATEPRRQGLMKSLVGDIQNASVLVRGDVLGQNVSLENAIVLGRVQAANVELRHSVVFGAVVATEQLRITASTVFYYHARDVEFAGPCALIHPTGESLNEPVFVPYEDSEGGIWASDIRYYPMFRHEGDGPLTNRPDQAGRGYKQARIFPEHDWTHVLVNEPRQRSVEGALTTVYEPGERYLLSLAGRILNLTALDRTLTDVYDLLRSGLEYLHYEPGIQRETEDMWQRVATPEELWMLQQISQPVSQEGLR